MASGSLTCALKMNEALPPPERELSQVVVPGKTTFLNVEAASVYAASDARWRQMATFGRRSYVRPGAKSHRSVESMPGQARPRR